MSKINPEVLEESVADIIKNSLEVKKRKFIETIELQVALKNYDPSKDKRFAGSMALPNECKRSMTICVLGDQIDCDKAAKIGMPFMSIEGKPTPPCLGMF
jgi:large subunit ribosomal protein L10Ae